MNGFRKFYAYLQYREAAKKANAAHAQTKNRYYVMPNAAGKVKLIVTDRTNFRQLRMKHYISSEIKLEDVMKVCFYHTPDRMENGGMTDSERASKLVRYFDWYGRRLSRDKKKPGFLRAIFHKGE